MASVIPKKYEIQGCFDEMFNNNTEVRAHYQLFKNYLEQMEQEELDFLQKSTENAQRTLGMTFNVYTQEEQLERVLPLDIIPRIINHAEWTKIEEGLTQRITALNLFIQDVYNHQNIIKDKIVPKEMIFSGTTYLKECQGFTPPKNIWCHISGMDLIRDNKGGYFVLEDNLRCPSGVSYMLENREILKTIFPDIFEQLNVQYISNYTDTLRNMLESLSTVDYPTIAVLTPGLYNSAYFEHAYLAQQMGVELVEGRDLVVDNHFVYMITTAGLKRVDVIYRRIDDDFLDPNVFRKDSLLGTPGLFNAYKKGNVVIVNAPGTGVADDKAIYAYIPKIIQYYLNEDIKLPNIKTYLCEDKQDLQYVLENIHELVVKQTDASGGYGMLIGPKSTKKEQEEFILKIKKNPRNYIAQPTISLSRVPILTENTLEGRHVDLRPFVIYGDSVKIIPGALTRVALKKGSLVVNSSQGGGSKDTWVLGK